MRSNKKAKQLDFSLVIPCYNESEHLLKSFEELLKVLRNTRYSFEIIMIDDKSTDKTVNLIKKIARENKEVRVYFHKKNIGRGKTVKDGILLSKSTIVGFIDIDLEIPADYIPKFVRTIKEGKVDVAIAHRHYAFRIYPPNYLLREIATRTYVKLIKFLLKLPFEDTEAGYKFFNKEKLLPVLIETQNPHWFWDTEIITRSYLHGLNIKLLPVLFRRRSDKTSTVKIVPDTLEYLRSIKTFKQSLSKDYSSPGIIYKSTFIYEKIMKILFRKEFKERYKTIVKLVSNGSSVIDVCCGDAKLITFLKKKNISYLGLDSSISFINSLLKKGVHARLSDIEREEIPNADYIIIQGSLYQFKYPKKILKKLYSSSRKALIISESVHNLEESLIGKTFLKKLMPYFVRTNFDNPFFRFNEKSLKKLLNSYYPKYMSNKGSRDLIAIIKK